MPTRRLNIPGPAAALLADADAVLRGRGDRVGLAALLLIVTLFGCLYGATMGSFTGVWDGRPTQLLYSAAKVPLLLLACFAVALPSFFALNTILGLRDDFAQVVRALATSQAALTLVLAALAPLTLLFYAGTQRYPAAVLWNGLVFLSATLAGQFVLRRAYRPLVERDGRHRVLMWVWGLTYAFVGIQAAWVLRPFVGSPGRPVEFFREAAWGNAYVQIAQLVAETVGGG